MTLNGIVSEPDDLGRELRDLRVAIAHTFEQASERVSVWEPDPCPPAPPFTVLTADVERPRR